MSSRRTHLNCLIVLVIALFGLSSAGAQDPSLEDTLKNGLKARRPVEFQFVAKVAELTNDGKLPRDYVLAAFDYARNRRPKLPLPYFEFIVRKKAEEMGVAIDVPSTLTN